EFPRLRVGTELALELTTELRFGPLLVGIDRRSVHRSSLERLSARRAHATPLDQVLGTLDVHGAPRAARRSGSEPDRVAHVIEAPPNAVDPPPRQRLVHCPPPWADGGPPVLA